MRYASINIASHNIIFTTDNILNGITNNKQTETIKNTIALIAISNLGGVRFKILFLTSLISLLFKFSLFILLSISRLQIIKS